MNNGPTDYYKQIEEAGSRQEEKNILVLLRHQEQRRQAKAKAIRASYISPKDQF